MSKTILVVDDDRINIRILELRLSKDGFKVVTAVNGEEALKRFQSQPPDLILLDVEMPEMNGYTFVRELAKLEGGQAVPILVMTVHEEMLPVFQINNVKDHLIKPIDLDVLRQKIGEYLG